MALLDPEGAQSMGVEVCRLGLEKSITCWVGC